MKTNPELKNVQETLGFVPSFLQAMESQIDTVKPSFDLLQKFAFGPSQIEPKYRALIGIGVATAIGSKIGVAFHSQSAQLTVGEINEAEFFTAHTLGWSTWMHGRQVDLEVWRKDVEKMRANLAKLGPGGPSIPRNADTKKQIQAAFGFVPEVLVDLGKLPGALEPSWELIRVMEFEQGHIPQVYRNLLGLAVCAAMHCPYLTLFHNQAARMHGATEAQVLEACMLARGTMQWASYLQVRGIGPEAVRQDALRLTEATTKATAAR